MKKIKKFLAVSVIISIVTFFQIAPAEAAVMTSFGGLSVGLIPCTGSGSTVKMLNIFFPLFLNSAVPTGGLLGVPPAITFSGYKIHPKVYALGTFTPGAAVCIIGSCPYCIYIPNQGLILPFTGASLI